MQAERITQGNEEKIVTFTLVPTDELNAIIDKLLSFGLKLNTIAKRSGVARNSLKAWRKRGKGEKQAVMRATENLRKFIEQIKQIG